MNPNNPWWGTLIELNGDPIAYIELLYAHFNSHFIDSRPRLDGKQVLHDSRDDGGKCACFVHITSKDDEASGARVLDLRRSERLCWIRPIIENVTQPEVLRWDEEKGRQRRVFLYLANERFLVILEETKYGYMLVTAYYVERDHTHERYLRKYDRYNT